jgi:hypothetical protein
LKFEVGKFEGFEGFEGFEVGKFELWKFEVFYPLTQPIASIICLKTWDIPMGFAKSHSNICCGTVFSTVAIQVSSMIGGLYFDALVTNLHVQAT